MADDKTKKGPADRDRINVHEDYELRYLMVKDVRHSAARAVAPCPARPQGLIESAEASGIGRRRPSS